jgi:hypothetical protein
MKLFGYIIEPSLSSKHSFKHFRLHRRSRETRHLVWGKISIVYGREQFCEDCEKSIGLDFPYCDECYGNNFCECGASLEHHKGEDFCPSCR